MSRFKCFFRSLMQPSSTMFFVKHDGPVVAAIYRIRVRPDGEGHTSDRWWKGRWVEDPLYLGKYLAVGFDSDTDEVSAYQAERAIETLEGQP